MKTCIKCNLVKPLTEFYFRKENLIYRTECKDCTKKLKAIRESKPGVKELRALKEKQRRQKYKEEINKRLREQRNLPERRMQTKGIRSTSEYKRRSQRRLGMSSKQFVEWKQAEPKICVYCGKTDDLTVDHIEPLNRQGSHVTDNLVIACRSCNSSKQTSCLLVWLAKKKLVEIENKKSQ